MSALNAWERIVTVRLGEETYGICISCVESIVRWESLTRLPRMPRFLAGVLYLRGQTIPVMDLRIRLGIEPEPCGEAHRIVIAHINGSKVGFIVDGVREVLAIQEDQIESNIPLVSHSEAVEFMRGVLHLPQGFIILLSVEDLLSDKEKTRIQSLEMCPAA